MESIVISIISLVIALTSIGVGLASLFRKMPIPPEITSFQNQVRTMERRMKEIETEWEDLFEKNKRQLTRLQRERNMAEKRAGELAVEVPEGNEGDGEDPISAVKWPKGKTAKAPQNEDAVRASMWSKLNQQEPKQRA